ncbi:MAG TPA: hypothetical protein VNA69_24880 [Thermoanaerobaculia bacterium]|nr:hypothetical protein [Thermoanaerobaculia bacterium]
MWTARRILKELADADRRRAILTAFWKHGDTHAQVMAQMQLAKLLHFREETIRKMPPEKKADLLASRIGLPELDQFLEMALMQYHTHARNEMMAAFLDRWNIPHENGSIEVEEYTVPDVDQVREAVRELEGSYDRRDIAIYLATAGVLMEEQWSAAAWPVAEELARKLLS